MTLFKTDHLTCAFDPQIQNAIERTVPGMAHFAGSGPAAKCCRECSQFHAQGYYAKNGIHGGKLKDGVCRKFSAMMRGEIGGGIPPQTMSCKYFVESPKAPALYERDAYK